LRRIQTQEAQKQVNVWQESMFSSKARIAGFSLHPLSVWHVLCLSAFNNPLVTGAKAEITAGHMAQFLCVCSCSCTDGLRLVNRFARSKLFRWRVGLRLMFRQAATLAAVYSYMADYERRPETWSGGEGKRSAVDSEFLLASILQREYGMSEVDAFDCPYSRAYCYAMVVAEANGADLVDEDQMAKARAMIEAANNG
jgi:hypothetical protein